MVRWLEANGYNVELFDRRRYRSPRSRDPRTQGLPVGRPRRVLVRGAADERREPHARRGVHLGVLQRQRDVLEDAMGEQHRRRRDRVPDARQLQGDARERQDRSPDCIWTGTWRDPRFSPPADGGRPENALTGTIFMVNCGHRRQSRFRRPKASCASGGTPTWRRSRAAGVATLADRHARVRMGRGSSTTAPARPG